MNLMAENVVSFVETVAEKLGGADKIKGLKYLRMSGYASMLICGAAAMNC